MLLLCKTADPDIVAISEVKDSEEWPHWEAAIKKEIRSLEDNETWTVTSLPEGRKAIGCRFVLKRKRNGSGKIESYKARLVAQGYSQKEGVDYTETFAPVTQFTTIMLLINIAAAYDLEVHQMDFDTAYLNASLREDLYMKIPEECDHKNTSQVFKLNKAIYGLKQAGNEWFNLLKSQLRSKGWEQSVKELCLFKKNLSRAGNTTLIVYVDDIVLLSPSTEDMQRAKQDIAIMFKVKDLGELAYILGVRVYRVRSQRKFFIDQEALIERTVEKYLDANCKKASTPMGTSDELLPYEGTSDETSKRRYQAIIGSLLYLSRYTRPDISFSVGVLSRFASNPGPVHHDKALRVLRYLKGTRSSKLTIKGQDCQRLTVFCDADWANDKVDRKSTSGYAIYLGKSPIAWKSKKQTCVSLSTMEAEFIALSEGVREALWLDELLGEVRSSNSVVNVFCDNQATISAIKGQKGVSKAKHIDIKHHYLRNLHEQQKIQINYVESNKNIADVFTKPLPIQRFNNFKQALGLIIHSPSGSVGEYVCQMNNLPR